MTIVDTIDGTKSLKGIFHLTRLEIYFVTRVRVELARKKKST